MKKAYELSVLCGLNINISFFDPTLNKIIEFATNEEVTMT